MTQHLRTVDYKVQWVRQGQSLGVSSHNTVYLWWPIAFLALVWDRCLRIVGHELSHQMQALLKQVGRPDLDADSMGHHPAAHDCLMEGGKNFWTTNDWRHGFVSRSQCRDLMLNGVTTLAVG